ncbi:lipase family protein [Nocardia sp. NPDC019395]|uniref:lipase family protein n=1 Tax=Nocardia sp. NPDC019395 TaxID=3154686 RepID=UPI0033E6FDC6
MRCLRTGLLALLVIVPLLTGPAAAAPPAPPGLPFPGLPVSPSPANAGGAILPGIQQFIDRVLPPPPIAQAPGPVPTEETTDMAPGTAALRQAVLPAPVGDPIFDLWPSNLADFAPGAVLEVRDVTATAAPLIVVPIRQALLFKYRTTDAHGRPSFATATLVIPATTSPVPGARPVMVNNLPIDALGRQCTPSYTLAHGFSPDSSLTDFVPPTTHLAALRGYAVLIPDHEGPLMAYAEPYVAGHAVLDAVRAVRGWRADEFGESRFAMAGYSGGAIATHGAVKLIESYAPDLAPSLVGAALGGVPADYEILARSMNGNLASGVFMAAVLGIARERPEILSRMNHLAQWVATSPMKDQCVSTFSLPGVLLLPIDIAANIADPLQSTLAHDIYEVTRMAGLASATPLYVYNGEQEFWIPAEGARNLYYEQCSLGVPAVYRSVLGEHVVAAGLGYPEAITWLDERLRGLPAVSEC